MCVYFAISFPFTCNVFFVSVVGFVVSGGYMGKWRILEKKGHLNSNCVFCVWLTLFCVVVTDMCSVFACCIGEETKKRGVSLERTKK